MTILLRCLAACLLALAALPALAVNYTFPGNLPAGCSRVGLSANYTCSGGALGYNDTVTINSPTPATVTVNGNLDTSNARINEGGATGNLTLIVNGTLTTDYQARINANVTAYVIDDSGGGQVAFGGSLNTTTGAITLGYASTVGGNITSTSGAIAVGGTVQVGGQVSCSCALTLAFGSRVVGNVSAASVISNGQVFLQGSVTATGAVDLGYDSTLGGAVRAGSTLQLRGEVQTSYCLQSTSSSTITLAWNDRANGGVCCGSLGSCTSSCVVNNSGAAMPALCSGSSPPSSTPARFNAFETSTAAASITGVIKTKVAGSSFTVAIVAVNTAGTGVATSFTGNVRVEVLDSATNSGAMNGTTNCRSGWNVAGGTSSTTLSFAAADLGRKNVTLTVPDTFRDARIRVVYPDTGTATATGCSTDNFAIRPLAFTGLSVTDTTSATAGTARVLDTLTSSGGEVHQAGQPFTVRATAVNGAATPLTTANYNGTPVAALSACSGTACGGTLGTLTLNPTANAGVILTSAASYSEAGAFNLQLLDSSFASVDAGDGSTSAEMTIASPVLGVGRFVPDHFDVVNLITPVLRTFNSSSCGTRSFTYLGQPFGYATRPQATVIARNAAGTTTVNYPNAKLAALGVTQAYAPLVSATPGLDSSAATAPAITVNGNGTAVLAAQAGDLLTMVRSATTPSAPFNASISLTWSVSDSSETAVTGNGTIGTTTPLVYNGAGGIGGIAFDAGSEFRYGQLRLPSAYGSELAPLAATVEAQHWNGTSFVTNSADQCTTLPTSSVSLANFRGNLAACETAPSATSVTFANGRGMLRLTAPGNGNAGSVDVTLQLGATITAGALRCSAVGGSTSAAVAANLPWLQGKAPGGTSFNQNPGARFSFGQYRSPLIHQRELY